MAAALVGVLGLLNVLSELSLFRAGTGIFVTGFLLYTAVWEYGRWNPFRDDVPANSAVD